MSAWAQLVNSNGSEEHLELCNEALMEIQRETARKLAEKIRSFRDVIREADWLADLIDPEVD
jgi:hypothetical protein